MDFSDYGRGTSSILRARPRRFESGIQQFKQVLVAKQLFTVVDRSLLLMVPHRPHGEKKGSAFPLIF